MGIMTGRVSIAANTTSLNLLAGQNDELLQRPSEITILLTAAATGLSATYQVGSRVIIDDQLVSEVNRFPLVPDDVVAKAYGVRNDRQFLRIRNSTGAAIIVWFKVNTDIVA